MKGYQMATRVSIRSMPVADWESGKELRADIVPWSGMVVNPQGAAQTRLMGGIPVGKEAVGKLGAIDKIDRCADREDGCESRAAADYMVM
jgi:hypothetical protein